MVTKIQLASMSRADIPASERIPFYLYVDEFQHFATDSFATILSEARKYALNLTVANQYIAQMSQEVKDAVFGNVGSMIAFRMGADDARSMQKYFEPRFTEYDLVHMHNRHFVINMTIDGEKSPAFSAITLNLPPQQFDETLTIVHESRAQYTLTRSDVERYIQQKYGLTTSARAESMPPIVQKQQIPATSSEVKKPVFAPKKANHQLTSAVVGHAAVARSIGALKQRRRRRRNKRSKSGLEGNTERVIFSKQNEGQ